MWERELYAPEDLLAFVEVALLLSEYENRDEYSQLKPFEGRAALAIVCMFVYSNYGEKRCSDEKHTAPTINRFALG